MAFAARAAELEVLAAGRARRRAAVRELLALQASDWAFMVSRELARAVRARALRRAIASALARALAERRAGRRRPGCATSRRTPIRAVLLPRR